MAFEIFISHASEGKASFVRPLAAWLDQRGVKVWYDEYVPVAGDSIREKINEGLLQCPYGVVVLSPRFYEKSWPRRKLNGLFSLMTGSTDGRLIPVLLNMSFTELGARDALLLDIKGISAERCVEASGRAIFEAMERDEAAKRHAGLTRYKHAAYSITTTDPPEDVPRLGYRFGPPYEFEELESALGPREILMAFLPNDGAKGYNAACHLTCCERCGTCKGTAQISMSLPSISTSSPVSSINPFRQNNGTRSETAGDQVPTGRGPAGTMTPAIQSATIEIPVEVGFKIGFNQRPLRRTCRKETNTPNAESIA